MTSEHSDTIVAVATPPGHGGIGIVRISGTNAFDCAATLTADNLNLAELPSHTVYHSHIKGGNKAIFTDEVLVTLFRKPKSYTGEDVVEISAHGNPLILQQIVALALKAGARQAEPGEFTRRAFACGRIDLVQAEAVADLISAECEAAQRVAIYQLCGKLSHFIKEMRGQLVEVAALFEVYIDFPEENLPAAEQEKIDCQLESIVTKLQKLADSYQRGQVLHSGIALPIVGPPNAGKSSLFNAIIASERAIVADIPGTTRDTIAETIQMGGFPIRLIDTAGLQETKSQIKILGIDRTRREMKAATLILVVFELTKVQNDESLVEAVDRFLEQLSCNFILIFNKCDLIDQARIAQVKSRFSNCNPQFVSAMELSGIDRLTDLIVEKISCRFGFPDEANTICNARHYSSVSVAIELLHGIRSKLSQGESFEFLAFDLRRAIESLDTLLGRITNNDLLNEIFGRFCIGK